jgi:hypothetical protein
VGLNAIGDEGARAFAGAIAENVTLRSLRYGIPTCASSEKTVNVLRFSLISNRIGDAGANAIRAALSSNFTLHVLQ